MSNKDAAEAKMTRSVRKYITYPFNGYVSEKGREAIKRLESYGFDHDLAFTMAESFLPENEFYDIPEEDDVRNE